MDLHRGVKKVFLTSQVNQLQAISIAAPPCPPSLSTFFFPPTTPFFHRDVQPLKHHYIQDY